MKNVDFVAQLSLDRRKPGHSTTYGVYPCKAGFGAFAMGGNLAKAAAWKVVGCVRTLPATLRIAAISIYECVFG